MPITAVRTASVYVSDQAKAIDFYTNTLGFALKAKMPMSAEAEWVEVVPPGGNTSIVLYPKAMMPDRQGCQSSIVLRTTDTIMTHKELASKGVKFTQEPVTMPWGYVFAQFEDPDGNWLGLSNQPF
jgi:lactoylglutathione lyase